jgi:hypothetical protein
MGMNHASLDCIAPTRGDAQLPNARVHTAPSPVPYDVPPVTSELTIKKKRKRANARQLEALNEVYTRTASPSKEERQQLARDLDMPASSVQIWLVHTSVYITCVIFNYSLGSRTKGRRAVEVDEILLTPQSVKSL